MRIASGECVAVKGEVKGTAPHVRVTNGVLRMAAEHAARKSHGRFTLGAALLASLGQSVRRRNGGWD